jgi:hypothetical protein
VGVEQDAGGDARRGGLFGASDPRLLIQEGSVIICEAVRGKVHGAASFMGNADRSLFLKQSV